MIEQEQAIRELSARHYAIGEILEKGELSECEQVWFEREGKITLRKLEALGVDKIVGPNGKEEVVIFDASKENEPIKACPPSYLTEKQLKD